MRALAAQITRDLTRGQSRVGACQSQHPGTGGQRAEMPAFRLEDQHVDRMPLIEHPGDELVHHSLDTAVARVGQQNRYAKRAVRRRSAVLGVRGLPRAHELARTLAE